jgi:hypothetical protein
LIELTGSGHDLLIDTWFRTIVCIFIHVSAAETQNPSLDVPFGNQVNNRLAGGARCRSCFAERILKLLETPRYIAGVCIDRYDQRRPHPRRPLPVCLDCLYVLLAYPLFSAASAAS